jgi:nitrite reductase (NO-forming)
MGHLGRLVPRHRIAALVALLGLVVAPLTFGACSSSSSASQKCPATVDATVHAHDSFRFTPDTLTAKSGKWVVKLVNDGSLTHTFQIHGVSGKAAAGGGSSACATFTLTKGTWHFYCGVAGHESAGMKGTLTVS